MTIAPVEKIYWSDIKAACITAIKSKCCNIDEMTSGINSAFIYGNDISFTGYTDATSTMPYHDVTVRFVNNDPVCQVVTSETVEQQFESYMANVLGTLGIDYVSYVSTYRSIVNLYDAACSFIAGRLVLINHPFIDSVGYVFYDPSTSGTYPYVTKVSKNTTMSANDMLNNLDSVLHNNLCSTNFLGGNNYIHSRSMKLTMTNECVTTGYPSGYAAYESDSPGPHTISITQAGVYDVHIVGGGGGGARSVWTYNGATGYCGAGGGGGAYVHWWQYFDVGNYAVTIGGGGNGLNSSSYGGGYATGGGNTTFLEQVAKGGDPAYAYGGIGAYDTRVGTGGGYETDYTGITGNNGSGGTGGASRYRNYGKGGNQALVGGNGAIVLFYKSTLAPVVFESSSTGSYTINITEEEEYEITIVGGGGGGSNNFGGAGAGIRFRARLSVGSYSGSIGNGGAGAPAYVRNNDGQTGGATTFNGQDISITCNGGIRRQGRRNGGGGGNTGTLVYNIGITYNILARTSDGVETPYGLLGSNYSAKGSGGQPQGSDTGAGYAGQSGYVCVRKLAGK